MAVLIIFDVPGTFPESNQTPSTHVYGFIRARDGSLITSHTPGSTPTYPTGINADSMVTGTYRDVSDLGPWFRSVLTFSVPGAIGIFSVGINDSGTVVGYYEDAN
jgi:hypothetical protein